ncbi:NADH peroxidase [Anaerohalosphaera lusitana]|uniref:NADH peroxidase n=1 Tax=Anaerohalosphaera lusitana TaxID=1936003 RepID=A0A1U9NKY2_9BACT|nr:rubrerythrin family protein [Anaerohalosphaera lusitana]AQT68602.1 NADH peroxidase [Anaerohalosphaera lusitana]
MSTKDNLSEAFAGESQANRKYEAFARRADKEGFTQIAKLFRATAAAEAVHCKNHMRVLKTVNTTAENLKVAMAGEEKEFKNMYPEFIKEAQGENESAAVMSFKYAMAVEQVHYSLYSEALARLEKGEDLEETTVHVCPVCGHTVRGEVPEKCPVCNAAKEKFFKVE